MWCKYILVFCAIWYGVVGNLRLNSNLHSFNAVKNDEVRRLLTSPTAILTLERDSSKVGDRLLDGVLFGFDIFAMSNQNFTVSVDYTKRMLMFELTTAIGFYQFNFDLSAMEKNETINTLYLRFDEEVNTVYAQVNCAVQGSFVSPINLIQFFRSVQPLKYKFLFNKRFEVQVYTHIDYVKPDFLHRCIDKQDAISVGDINQTLRNAAKILSRFAVDDANIIKNNTINSKLITNIFVQTFFFKKARRQDNPLYKTIHLVRSIMYELGPVFEAELERIVYYLFTHSYLPKYVRYGKPNYYEDSVIKESFTNIIFEDTTKIPIDNIRSQSEVGEIFRENFLNPNLSINKLCRNETLLKKIVYSVLLKDYLSEMDEGNMRKWHSSKNIFIKYYLKDVNLESKLLTHFYKLIILHANIDDYKAIGKFIRKIFFRPSGMKFAEMFIESDEEIGKRMVYLGALGILKGDLYRIVRMIIVKRGQELPKALENPKRLIQSSLWQTLGKRSVIISNLGLVLRDLIIYNDPNPGQLIAKGQGDFIYDLYRTLIMNDLQRTVSVMKKLLEANSVSLHAALNTMLSAVVDNVDSDKLFRKIAVDYVKNLIVESGETFNITDDNNYVKLFKLIFLKENSVQTDNRKILNTESLLVTARLRGALHTSVVDETLKMTKIVLNQGQTEGLKELFINFTGPTSDFVRMVDSLLRNTGDKLDKIEAKIEEEEIDNGIVFYEETYGKEDQMIFGLNEIALNAIATMTLINLEETGRNIEKVAYPGFITILDKQQSMNRTDVVNRTT